MVKSQFYSGNGAAVQDIPTEQIDTQLKSGKGGVLWIDMDTPTDEDFQMLEAEFGFHPLAMADLREKDQRPKVVEYGDYVFVVAHEWHPAKNREDLSCPCAEKTAELHVFVGRNYAVTLHDGPSQAVDTARKRWEGNKDTQRQGPYFLLYLLLDSMVDDYYPALDAYDDRIDTLERMVLSPLNAEDEDAPMPQNTAVQKPLTTLLGLRRDLLEMRRYVAPLRDAVNVLLRRAESVEDDEHEEGFRRANARALFAYFQDVYDHCIRVVDTIDTYRDLLSGTLDAHLAVSSHRLNEVVKVLTSVSIILMTVAAVSGVYGMNFSNMPELHWRHGYPYALSLMAVLSGVEWAYFKRRGWL